MDLMEFIEQTMKKHNVKTSLEEVLEAIRIEYEEQAKENKKGNVGVIGLDDATVEAIIIEAPAVIERNKAKQKEKKSVVKTEAKPKMQHFTPNKKEEKGNEPEDDSQEFLEQLGLWS